MAFSVWTTVACACTSTTSEFPGTLAVRFISVTWPTSAVNFSLLDLKPVDSADTSIIPWFEQREWYWPASFVTAVRISFVSMFLMVTVAPGITAPLVSATMPDTSPVVRV